MPKFISLKFKNSFAYGNEYQVVNFTKNTLTQIVGENGVGKTSIPKLLKIGWYFELEGVLVNEVANSINGNCEIEIEAFSNNHNWKILNEFSSSKLKNIKVWKDGIEQEFGKIPDTKREFKKQAHDIPFHLFNNIINLSVNDFKSFMGMKAEDTKNVRDRLFSFYILNEMSSIVTTESKKYSNEIANTLIEIKSLEDLIENSKIEYDNLQQKLEEENNLKSKELERIKNELLIKINESSRNKKDLENNLQKLNSKFIFFKNIISYSLLQESKEKLSLISKQIDDNNINSIQISTKKELLQEEKRNLSIKKLKTQYDEQQIQYNSLKEKIEKYKIEKNKVDVLYGKLEEKIAKEEQFILKKNVIEKLQLKFVYLNQKRDEYFHVINIIDDNEKILKDLKVKQEELNFSLQNKRFEQKANKEKIGLYELNQCPTCETSFSDELHLLKKENLIQSNENLTNEINLNSKIESDLKTRIEQTNSVIKTNETLKRNLEIEIFQQKFKQSEYNLLIEDVKIMEFSTIEISECVLNIENLNTQLLEPITDIKYFQDVLNFLNFKVDEQNIEKLKNKFNEVSTSKINSDKVLIEKETILKEKEKYLVDTKSLISEDIDFSKIRYESESEYEKSIFLIDEKIKQIKKDLDENLISKNEISNKINLLEQEITEQELKFTKSDLEEAKQKIELFKSEKENIEKFINNEINNLNNLNFEQKQNEKEFIELKNKKPHELDSLTTIIEKTNQKLEEIKKNSESKINSITFLKILNYTISEDGIKSFILSKIVPVINKEISKFLSLLNLNIVCIFDNEFKPKLKRFGQDASIKSISTGQTKMIDVCILLSITKIFLMKYPNNNLVFYDEIFSSLHVKNINIVLELIRKKMCQELGLEVCLINHSYIPSSMVDRIIEVSSKNNFSSLEIMSPDDFETKLLSK